MLQVSSVGYTWRNSTLYKVGSILPKKDRIKASWIALMQVFLSLLDLAGVVMIGALSALSVQALESKPAGNKVGTLLRLLHITHLEFRNQIVIIGILAAVLLIGKTLFSVFFTRKTYFFLSRRGAQISEDTIGRLLSQNLLEIQSRSSQQTLFMVTTGIQDLMIGILATSIQMVSDFALLAIMTIGMFLVDPVMATLTFIIFGAIGFILYRLLQVRAKELGVESYKLSVANSEKILEVLHSYRESVVRNRRAFYSIEIGKLRYKVADNLAESSFMPYISKYVLDSTTVFGALILGSYEFANNNAVHALSIMALFIAASSRIAPAALRIQQGILVIKNSTGASEDTIALIDKLKKIKLPDFDEASFDVTYDGFKPKIQLKNVHFSYPNASTFALDNINLTIPEGSSIAFVGPSGAGKTTLIDLILGVLDPTSGEILISNHSPQEASKKWPGAISYVPQDVVVINGTIRENVGLGYPLDVATDLRVNEAIETAQIKDLIKNMPLGLDTTVGENGSNISGGQRQRLGIARSLFTKPRLLVLDEATSALDGQTEADIGSAIQVLKGHVTVIIVAHRLSTIRNVDQIGYIGHGKLLAVGSFEEVRNAIPDFDSQATLMGL